MQRNMELVTPKKTKDLLLVKAPYPKARRSFNAKLIPEYLARLAREGKYYESRVIN